MVGAPIAGPTGACTDAARPGGGKMGPMPDEDRSKRRRQPTELGSRAERGRSLARLSASAGAGYLSQRMRALAGAPGHEAEFHAANAERFLEVLGGMKGMAMKVGQIASFVDLDLPPDVQETYRAVLADLRDQAPPTDPEVIADVIDEQFGAPPEEVFARWQERPIAAASIGQVHRATLPTGEEVAVKVQYPGVAEAVESDLANAEMLVPFVRLVSPNLDVKPLAEELRARVVDELDYQREAQYQQAFAERYDGHPFIRVPRVHADWCRPRVLTADYVEGRSFDRMLATSSPTEQRRYGEIIFRFVFGSLYRFRLFNADPHPGNYLFPDDGTVAFLDFGSVKLFPSKTRAQIREQIDAVLDEDVERLMASMRASGFVRRDAKVDEDRVMQWFRDFNAPLLDENQPFTYTPEFAKRVIASTTDPRLGHVDVLRKLNLPPDYLTLNRIQWGVNSILGRLEGERAVAGGDARDVGGRAARHRARSRGAALRRRLAVPRLTLRHIDDDRLAVAALRRRSAASPQVACGRSTTKVRGTAGSSSLCRRGSRWAALLLRRRRSVTAMARRGRSRARRRGSRRRRR